MTVTITIVVETRAELVLRFPNSAHLLSIAGCADCREVEEGAWWQVDWWENGAEGRCRALGLDFMFGGDGFDQILVTSAGLLLGGSLTSNLGGPRDKRGFWGD